MAARTKSKVTPKYKTKYRVRNWAAYEESLRRRGDITVWFDDHAVDSWNAPPSGRPGGQKEYSDAASETALTLRSLFHLGLRQTESFVGSLVRLMRLKLRVPDHTTLSRRGRTIDVRSLPRKGDGPLHLVIACGMSPAVTHRVVQAAAFSSHWAHPGPRTGLPARRA